MQSFHSNRFKDRKSILSIASISIGLVVTILSYNNCSQQYFAVNEPDDIKEQSQNENEIFSPN
jgi:hypothetical protein